MAFLLFVFVLSAISCETNEPSRNEIEGTYYGTLTSDNSVSKFSTMAEEAVAVIRKTGDQEVEVHCYSTEFDTIFRLNYFPHEGGFKVCTTGIDFEQMYHMPYSQPMGMGMRNSGTAWSDHLNSMHKEGDRHFGAFDPDNHSFEYYFLLEQENTSNLQFRGYRNKN